MQRPKQVVAMGGGGFSMEPENPLLDDFVLGLTGASEPKVCFLPTASGDADSYIVKFYDAFKHRARPTHLALFRRTVHDLTEFLTAQDVIYVGGGNTVNMLAVWRAQGMGRALRTAWERGVVLCGISAGSLCWFEGGVTDSFGELAPLRDGLGFLPGTHCPHYDGEAERRAAYQSFVQKGLPPGIAVDDGAALHFAGTELHAVVASRPNARAYRVEHGVTGAVESILPSRYLGA